LQVGEWLVDPTLDTLFRGNEAVKLEPRTMRLLLCLASAPGSVVSVEQLLNEVWPGVVVGPASVYQSVSQLRKLLGDVDPNPTYIATVPRKGYRLIAPVREPARDLSDDSDASRSTAVMGADVPASSALPSTPSAGAASTGTPSAGTPSAGTPTAAATDAELSSVGRPDRGHRAILLWAGAAVIACVALVSWQRLKLPTSPGSAEPAASIVVLPFMDLTSDKSNQALCDGLTEELSNWLSQIPTLRVVARTSAFAFRGQEDVRKIGQALDINHVLEGSLRRSSDRMRVTVQLIDARTGFHLWSQDFDRPVQDTIELQEDISRSVARTLQVRLTAEPERQLSARRSIDPQVYQLYFQARYFSRQLTPDATDRAIDLYRQVLEADPNFVPARIYLAYAYLNQGYFHDLPIAEVAPRMEPLIDTALRIDEHFSPAYAVRGALRAEQSRVPEALADLEHAVSLNPNDMGAFADMGRLRIDLGRPREALQSYDRAVTLDPLNPALQIQRCLVLDDLAQYTEALSACERARVLQPGRVDTANGFTWLAESRGRLDEALSWNLEVLKAEPTQNFDWYWTRVALYLEIGLGSSAHAALERGHRETSDDENASAASVRVVFLEGGHEALRKYLDAARLDQSTHAVPLFEAAYARLLLGEAAAAKELLARAVGASDYVAGFADSPFYARGARAMGTSYRVDLAAAELALGHVEAAHRELDRVLGMLNGMIAAGVSRHATYELRARALALAGNPDAAMRDLGHAAQLGWRRAWWAAHEPYFASLRGRPDFQALLSAVNQSNAQLTSRLHADP
jgi:TolB-like protein/DNA-binding winged helix-turn-helix (wHTH) protein/Tfp pilus assembly protein PilF